MAFRRTADHARSKAWKRWIGEHRSQLEKIGLPLAVYADAGRWQDFLENGHLHWHEGGPPFDFTALGPGQAAQLWAFLEGLGLDPPPPLLGWLRVRLGKSGAR